MSNVANHPQASTLSALPDVPPLQSRAFRWLWIGGLAANIGSAARETGTGWAMTELTRSELLVASVQTAVALPSFALAIPAGALADVIDRRRLLLAVQVVSTVAAGVLAIAALSGALLPGVLLLLTAVLGVTAAVGNPAWQTYMSGLVSPARIAESSALNSLSMNLARAVGPALGGALVAAVGGPWVVFALHAITLGAMIYVVSVSPAPLRAGTGAAPAERLVGAVRAGWRYVRHSPPLRAVLVRTTSFVLPASALWALLPLIARDKLGLGAGGYGLLMACMGGGAVSGALAFPFLRQRVSLNALAVASTLAMAACMTLLALSGQGAESDMWRVVGGAAMVAGGGGWVTVVMCSNSSAQTGAPSWVRARALSWYFTIHFGCMAGGSALWGSLAQVLPHGLLSVGPVRLSSVGVTLLCAVSLLLAGLATIRRWPFAALSRSMLEKGGAGEGWPDPVVNRPIGPDDGPVVVTVEYTVATESVPGFKAAMADLSVTRYRDGAVSWMLCQQTEDPSQWLEVFIVESWAEHLRQHDRVTAADLGLLRAAHAFHAGPGRPRVRHAIAAEIKGDDDRRGAETTEPVTPG